MSFLETKGTMQIWVANSIWMFFLLQLNNIAIETLYMPVLTSSTSVSISTIYIYKCCKQLRATGKPLFSAPNFVTSPNLSFILAECDHSSPTNLNNFLQRLWIKVADILDRNPWPNLLNSIFFWKDGLLLPFNSSKIQLHPNLRDPKHRHLYIAVEHVVRHSYLLKPMDSLGESPGKHMKAAPLHKSNQLNIATATSANM